MQYSLTGRQQVHSWSNSVMLVIRTRARTETKKIESHQHFFYLGGLRSNAVADSKGVEKPHFLAAKKYLNNHRHTGY